MACHLVGAKLLSEPVLDYCKLDLNFQWNFNKNSYIFIKENAFETVVCEVAAILSRLQCVQHIFILIEGQLFIGGLVQERHNSITNALELRLSCTNPPIWSERSHLKQQPHISTCHWADIQGTDVKCYSYWSSPESDTEKIKSNHIPCWTIIWSTECCPGHTL